MHMSEPVQKALLAVGSGLALIFSIIALVISISAGGGHGDKHDGGRMFGGAPQGQMGGGPQQGQMGGGQRGQAGPGVGGPGQRQGVIPPGGVQITPNGTGTTTTK